MKIYNLAIVRKTPRLGILAAEYDLSSFGFFERGRCAPCIWPRDTARSLPPTSRFGAHAML